MTADTITATETFNAAKLRYILGHAAEYGLVRGKSERLDKALKSMRETLAHAPDGVLHAKHHRSSPGIGRYYPEGGMGLVNFHRPVRNAVVEGIYLDFDIVNCVGTLFAIIAERVGVCHEAIVYYNHHRDECLAELMSLYNLEKRDDAKHMVTQLYFEGGLPRKVKPPQWMVDLKREVKTLNNRLWDDTRYASIRTKCEGDTGKRYPKNSFIAYVYQTYESHCQDAMRAYARREGFIGKDNSHSPEHDGVKLPVERVGADIDGVIKGMEAAILEYTGFELRVKNKPMDERCELPEGWEAWSPIRTRTYEEIQPDFERDHFKLMNPLCFCRIEPNGELYMMSSVSIGVAYSNLKCDCGMTKGGKRIVKDFVSMWKEDPTMRTYNRLDFLPPPLKCPEGVFNTYNGIRAEGLPSEYSLVEVAVPHSDTPIMGAKGLDLVLKHLNCLAGDNPAMFKYLTRWFAHRVQKPADVPGVAPIFRSDQGTGKNIFFDFFGTRVLGSTLYTVTSSIEDLTGQFAQGMRNKLLVVLDEAQARDTFSVSDRLKSMITAETLRFERKGIDATTIRHCAGYAFLTNNTIPVKLEPGDRRHILCDVVNDRAQDPSYFQPLADAMADDAVAHSFFTYLKGINLTGFNLSRDRVITDGYRDLQAASLDLFAHFVDDYMSGEIRSSPFGNQSVVTRKVAASDLFEAFRTWSRDNNYNTERVSSKSFGSHVSKWLGVSTKPMRIDGKPPVRGFEIQRKTVETVFAQKRIKLTKLVM